MKPGSLFALARFIGAFGVAGVRVACHIVQFVCSICLESAAYGLPVIVNAQMRGEFYETFMKRRAARLKIHRQR